MNRAVLRFEVYDRDEFERRARVRRREALRQTLRTWRRYYAPLAVAKRIYRALTYHAPDFGPGPDEQQAVYAPVVKPLRPASGQAVLQVPIEPQHLPDELH